MGIHWLFVSKANRPKNMSSYHICFWFKHRSLWFSPIDIIHACYSFYLYVYTFGRIHALAAFKWKYQACIFTEHDSRRKANFAIILKTNEITLVGESYVDHLIVVIQLSFHFETFFQGHYDNVQRSLPNVNFHCIHTCVYVNLSLTIIYI